MLGVLFSGGKDSAFSLYHYWKKGEKIGCLISLVSENKDSWMFHTPAMNMVEIQAEAMEIPILVAKTRGEKEKELLDLESAIRKAKSDYKLTGIVAGALFSKYQYDRVVKICDSLNLDCFAPLWQTNQETVVRDIIESGFEVIVTKIASQGLDESFLGRKIDYPLLEEFIFLNKKNGFHIAGEGGEYESLVLDAPMFRKRIVISASKKIMHSDIAGTLEIESAFLEEK
jgi:diphthine-ammonia ligase